jgi:predicted metal-dependent peptidase
MRHFTPEEKIQNARLALVTEFVFFGSVFFRLDVFEDPTCDTAWTDGVSIGYNLPYTASLRHEEIIGLFIHEILHVIFKHHLRQALDPEFKKNHDKFNRAADYALNPTIENATGMAVNPNWLLDMDRWPNHLAEDIFYQLKDDASDDKCKNGGKPGDGPAEGNGSPGPSMPGEVREYKNGKASPAEIEQASNEIDQWVQSAGMKAEGVGKMTDGIKRMIKKVVDPQVYWGDELQHLLDEISRDDYTWTRPNVRYMQQGVYLPSMYSTTMPDLLFYVDVSGSLDDKQLTQIKAEIRTIVAMYNVRIIVVYWNTCYQNHEEFYPEDVFNVDWALNARGSGGTDFKDCWDWYENQDDIDPKGLVFFTDTECYNWPEIEPDFPVVWCHVDNPGCHNDRYYKHMPDYGTLVKVPVGGP